MRIITTILMLGLSQPALAQGTKPTEEKEIVITGVADGARAVEVDFDQVWRRCAECKRALLKLDKLSAAFRSEREIAYTMGSGGPAGGQSDNTAASNVGSWQRSSADSVEKFAQGPSAFRTTSAGLALARRQDVSRRTTQEMMNRYASPEMAKLQEYMRSFIDQLTPHVVAAAEQERRVRGARISLIGKPGMKTSAKQLVRIDVTNAVIKRIDAENFVIDLPDPPARQKK
ncbi:MAG: hypothetical protein ABIR87_01880 [Sphingomicrobium sp.]